MSSSLMDNHLEFEFESRAHTAKSTPMSSTDDEDVWVCDRGCGFQGTEETVARHEETCMFAPVVSAISPDNSMIATLNLCSEHAENECIPSSRHSEIRFEEPYQGNNIELSTTADSERIDRINLPCTLSADIDELGFALDRYDLLMYQAGVVIATYDLESRELTWSQGWEEMYLEEMAMPPSSPSIRIHWPDRPKVHATAQLS